MTPKRTAATAFASSAGHGRGCAARRRLKREVRHALDRSEFVLHYQPQLELATARFAGSRLSSAGIIPSTGLSRRAFIPAAEAIGMIRRWVNGCWRGPAGRPLSGSGKAGQELSVAVNLSPAQLRHPGCLAAAIDAALTTTGPQPGRLELEITEGVLMENVQLSIGLIMAPTRRATSRHMPWRWNATGPSRPGRTGRRGLAGKPANSRSLTGFTAAIGGTARRRHWSMSMIWPMAVEPPLLQLPNPGPWLQKDTDRSVWITTQPMLRSPVVAFLIDLAGLPARLLS